MSFREGQRVAYIGDGDYGLQPGDRGRVLSAEAEAAHILWLTGSQQGNLLFHSNYDLVAQTAELPEDSLSDQLVTVSVRSTFDRHGSEGLLNALAEEGHLATLGSIAEDALGAVSSRIREDPAFIEVMGQLDVEEADHLVTMAAYTLLKDCFGEEQ